MNPPSPEPVAGHPGTTTAVVLAVHGWLQLRAELTNLRAVNQRELSLVASAVRSAIENAVRDGQQPDVIALLDRLELNDPNVSIFVFDQLGNVTGSTHGAERHLPRVRTLLEGTDRSESAAVWGL